MKKLILSTAVIAALGMGASTSASAALVNGDVLNFNPGVVQATSSGGSKVTGGSYFGMDADKNGTITLKERSALVQNDGLILGTTQSASGSHTGAPGCTPPGTGTDPCTAGSETAGIDQPWTFFGSTGLDYTTNATNVLSASGNTATVDFSGWTVTWNGIAAIPMNSGAWGTNANGVADITCNVDCAVGDTYVLDYTATVPAGDASGFGGVSYQLHLEGSIAAGAVSAVPVPAAAWLFGSGLLGLVGVARRKKAQV